MPKYSVLCYYQRKKERPLVMRLLGTLQHRPMCLSAVLHVQVFIVYIGPQIRISVLWASNLWTAELALLCRDALSNPVFFCRCDSAELAVPAYIHSDFQVTSRTESGHNLRPCVAPIECWTALVPIPKIYIGLFMMMCDLSEIAQNIQYMGGKWNFKKH